jgi:hypothetical protein
MGVKDWKGRYGRKLQRRPRPKLDCRVCWAAEINQMWLVFTDLITIEGTRYTAHYMLITEYSNNRNVNKKIIHHYQLKN